jgi:large subunit ribosomal protein L32e
MKMAKKKFLRIGYTQYSKLGLRRKNKQVYRKGKGGENKMRLKMKGHLRNVSIGFRSEKKNRGLVKGMSPVIVLNVNDLKNLKEKQIPIIAKIGNKKKIEMAEYAIKNNIRFMNLNPKKFLEKIEEIKKKEKEEKKLKETKKKTREKEAKKAEKEKEEKDKEEKSEKKEESNLEDTVKDNETSIKENVEEKK